MWYNQLGNNFPFKVKCSKSYGHSPVTIWHDMDIVILIKFTNYLGVIIPHGRQNLIIYGLTYMFIYSFPDLFSFKLPEIAILQVYLLCSSVVSNWHVVLWSLWGKKDLQLCLHNINLSCWRGRTKSTKLFMVSHLEQHCVLWTQIMNIGLYRKTNFSKINLKFYILSPSSKVTKINKELMTKKCLT